MGNARVETRQERCLSVRPRLMSVKAIYQQLGKHNVRATLAFHDALNRRTSRVPEWTNYQLHQEQLIPAARREVCVTPILYLAVCGKEMLDDTGMKENASC